MSPVPSFRAPESWLGLAAALLMLGACSSKPEPDGSELGAGRAGAANAGAANAAGAGAGAAGNGGTGASVAGQAGAGGAGFGGAGNGGNGGAGMGASGGVQSGGVAGEGSAGQAGTSVGGATNQAGAAGGGRGGEGGGSAGAAPGGPVSVYIAGDSTVSNYADTASSMDLAGWGQMLHEYFDTRVTIENRAVGGMTARHFIENGYLDDILGEIQPGDYFLVQFGTNDGNRTATYELDGETIPYYLDPQTDFKMYLQRYIQAAEEHDATLVFVTPPPRNSAYCTGGNGTGAHAEAMRELGTDAGIAVSDLNQKSVTYLEAICPAPTPEDFFLVRSDGSVDGTHFQENGARILAGFVADGIREAGLPLAAYLSE
jgi:lysophospholipase L1-like esterase